MYRNKLLMYKLARCYRNTMLNKVAESTLADIDPRLLLEVAKHNDDKSDYNPGTRGKIYRKLFDKYYPVISDKIDELEYDYNTSNAKSLQGKVYDSVHNAYLHLLDK